MAPKIIIFSHRKCLGVRKSIPLGGKEKKILMLQPVRGSCFVNNYLVNKDGF